MGYIPPIHHTQSTDYANRLVRYRNNYMRLSRIEHLRDFDRRKDAFPPPYKDLKNKKMNGKRKKQSHFSRYI